MAGLLFLTALAGFGLEIHPGCALRRAARESSAFGLGAGVRGRVGELLAVGALLGVVLLAILVLPAAARDHAAVRSGAILLSGTALLFAGWHRISTTSRLDLRRVRLLRGEEETRVPMRILGGCLGELRRPSWHAFWWAAAPGLALVAVGISSLAAPLLWLVYGAVVLGWSTFLTARLGRAGEKLVGTTSFRSLHSLGGLALVGASGLLYVEALDASGLAVITIDKVLRPLLGAG